MNKILKSIINLKYLIIEALAFMGSIVTFGATTIYFIEIIMLPFIQDTSNIVGTILSFCFLVFWILLFLYFCSWSYNKIRFVTEEIRGIFIK